MNYINLLKRDEILNSRSNQKIFCNLSISLREV